MLSVIKAITLQVRCKFVKLSVCAIKVRTFQRHLCDLADMLSEFHKETNKRNLNLLK